ncbi:LysM peptidoglycan-binding domain-containing protein [Cellulomonas chengniuliangii]|uniref:LysM domain-containing protein n=1 Tax=Cellulomonas chengniuliangii TaxID=2968084 RepID=A0ABY5KZ14_9CELL|nr:hypothetical protein [Cellulomonas chengniuliangii]MCC2308788.1 hypothetical protein [Cellulomonas chengniuliangii]UUI74466.1 hypothetical protein NP064_11735 [Cellulomonas chengniuliangii]
MLPAGLAASVALTLLLVIRLRSVTDAAMSTLRVEQAVEIGVVAVGAALTGWLATSMVIATACAAARALGGGWSTGERLVQRCAPALVRRTLVLALGAGIGLSLGGVAHASDADLGWAPTTPAASSHVPHGAAEGRHGDATDAGARAHPPATTAETSTGGLVRPIATPPGDPADPALGSPEPRQVTVRPGDSLWALAAADLGPGASDAEIAAAWPRWYAANAATIGSDPEVILPGQTLDVPGPESPVQDGRAS